MADDPAFLTVGTDVSAKYKGAFCEAKIKKVVRNIKCKVTFKGAGAGSTTVTDDAIKGTLRVGNVVEVKLDQKKDYCEAIITKIQDCSQYTVVFDDGDITTLRRSALCLKSGRHFAESETLDQLPLTHPEHFGNPVIGSSSRRGRRTNRSQSDDSDSEASEWAGGSAGTGASSGAALAEREPHAGRVVLVQCSTGDKKRAHHSHQWFPGLVVAPNAQDTVKIKVKDDYLVRSFKDGRYYTVPKKEAREFRRNNTSSEWSGLDAAILYLDKGILPTHWDRDILFGQESQSQSDDMDSDDSMDDEPHEKKDHFVAQLYKFMDDRGTPLNRQPTISNRDIDLYRLFNVVQKLGGYNRVTNQNQWKRVAARLGFHPASGNVINSCRQAYKKYLHSFDEFYRKLGVTLLSTPRSSGKTGRSLIRDKDKMHSTPKPASPATVTGNSEERILETKNHVKDKNSEKDSKIKEKDSKVKAEPKEVKISKEKDNNEKENKDKENKEKDNKALEKEKDSKKDSKAKDQKEKDSKEKKDAKPKQKEIKIKSEPIVSSEEDSADNQPLVPLTIKSEKNDTTTSTDKSSDKSKTTETPGKSSKLFKSASGNIDSKKSDKGSVKKITHRRNSLPRCNVSGNKSDQKETRCKSSSSDSSTTNRKQVTDEKPKEKDSSVALAKKHASLSDKNDSDSSRSSKNGKTPFRRNANSRERTPPSTPNSQMKPSKKPRKRKLTESNETNASTKMTANLGDKLKVYYGPTHSESKVTYEAKVIEIKTSNTETLYRVHYTGWNNRYDEWIKLSRIADNLTQYPKNKHKDKGKKNLSTSSGSSESSNCKKSRSSQPSSGTSSSSTKPHTRNRSSSNTTNASSQNSTVLDVSMPSDSDSDSDSDSSGQKQAKKVTEDTKIPQVKVEDIAIPDKNLNTSKEKSIKSKITKSPPLKRLADNSQNRMKRTRLKQDEGLSPRGRDFDLNEIRSELKGLDNAKKSPIKDSIKTEPASQLIKTDDLKLFKTEKTPEKVAEDIYEFKEPEPFEFEARKSEEKKKRAPRLFDDIPPLKLTPNSSPDKNTIPEIEKPASKFNYETVFNKLCHTDNYQNTNNTTSLCPKEEEKLQPFADIGEEDSASLMMSEADDSQDNLFTYQRELFPERPYISLFKGFTPAKNQETYSKKDTSHKTRDVDDDFTNSPIKGEQSSDEDPINAAIKRVNAHSMSDDSNDGDLLIKTSAISNVQASTLFPTFVPDAVETAIKESSVIKNEPITKSRLENLLKQKTDLVKSSTSENTIKGLEITEKFTESKSSLLAEMNETSLEKSDSDNTSSFGDVSLPEPPAGFLLHKEGPSIAEKVLRAINHAKRIAAPCDSKEPVGKMPKIDTTKPNKTVPPKNISSKYPVPNSQINALLGESVHSHNANISIEIPIFNLTNIDMSKVEIKTESSSVIEILPKSESLPAKCDTYSAKKENIERRKSALEPALGGKSNKVLSETIQKLSSQISQPIPTISIPDYPIDERSDTTDSDDSDSRLIIDKLSEEESQSCASLADIASSHHGKIHSDKSKPHWTNAQSTHNTEREKISVHEIAVTKESVCKQPEEDSNISLLLCEETIPGSPAPEAIIEAGKSMVKVKSSRAEHSFLSSSSARSDPTSKESSSHKDASKEKETSRESRESGPPHKIDKDLPAVSNKSSETVLDNTPPTTPESSEGNISPLRDQQNSDPDNQSDVKSNEDNRIHVPNKKNHELDKSHSNSNIRSSAPNSPGTGPRRGRRPRGCRVSDSEDPINTSSYSQPSRQNKYNFCVDLDPLLDGAARIALLTNRLSELRKVYHGLKAELATIDRRRKKIRRKEREAIKAAKAACS